MKEIKEPELPHAHDESRYDIPMNILKLEFELTNCKMQSPQHYGPAK